LEALDRRSHLVEIREIERRVGAEGKADPVRGERNPSDQIKNRRFLAVASVDAVVDRNFQHIKPVEMIARPLVNDGTISDADPAGLLNARAPAHSITSSARAS